MDYMSTTERVWPPYSTGRRIFVTGALGFAVPALRPGAASGTGMSFVGLARGGYAPGDSGLEFFGELGGNLAGPRALWFDAGARWMVTPSVHLVGGVRRGLAFHVGPELTLGGFVRLAGPDTVGPSGTRFSGTSDTHFTLGAAIDLILSITPSLQFEGHVGNLRWVPTGDGSLLLFGATLGAGLRF
jgi:hypothetical protein